MAGHENQDVPSGIDRALQELKDGITSLLDQIDLDKEEFVELRKAISNQESLNKFRKSLANMQKLEPAIRFAAGNWEIALDAKEKMCIRQRPKFSQPTRGGETKGTRSWKLHIIDAENLPYLISKGGGLLGINPYFTVEMHDGGGVYNIVHTTHKFMRVDAPRIDEYATIRDPSPIFRLYDSRFPKNIIGFGELDEKKAIVLKWKPVGSLEPTKGQQVTCDELANRLQEQQEFTKQEWKSFGIKEIRWDSYVKSGHEFFKPAVVEYEVLFKSEDVKENAEASGVAKEFCKAIKHVIAAKYSGVCLRVSAQCKHTRVGFNGFVLQEHTKTLTYAHVIQKHHIDAYICNSIHSCIYIHQYELPR